MKKTKQGILFTVEQDKFEFKAKRGSGKGGQKGIKPVQLSNVSIDPLEQWEKLKTIVNNRLIRNLCLNAAVKLQNFKPGYNLR